jgi:hypothetical protein
MRYRVLHLPTGTYLYHYCSNTGDLFSEHEYNIYYRNRSIPSSNIFDSLEIVEGYLEHWAKIPNCFSWDAEDDQKGSLKLEHVLIEEVDDE